MHAAVSLLLRGARVPSGKKQAVSRQPSRASSSSFSSAAASASVPDIDFFGGHSGAQTKRRRVKEAEDEAEEALSQQSDASSNSSSSSEEEGVEQSEGESESESVSESESESEPELKRRRTDGVVATSKQEKTMRKTDAKDGDRLRFNAEKARIEAVRAERNRLGIKVSGPDVPDLVPTFDDLKAAFPSLPGWIVPALQRCGYTEPTPVQRQVYPVMLADREVLAVAPTGSGKTMAFVVPILAQLKEPDRTAGFRALIVSPSRELALQTHREIKRVCHGGRAFRVCVLTKQSAAGVAGGVPLGQSKRFKQTNDRNVLDNRKNGYVAAADEGDGDSAEDEDEDEDQDEDARGDESDSGSSSQNSSGSEDDLTDYRGIVPAAVLHRRKLSKEDERRLSLSRKKSSSEETEQRTAPIAPFDILVTTPQRLVAMVQAHSVDLSAVTQVIFDEADKLFGEEQFLEQVDGVVAACTNPKRRVSFFSATMLPAAERLARSTQSSLDPVRILIGSRNVAVDRIEQSLVFCGGESGKLLEIKTMAVGGKMVPPTLIFVQSKDRAQQLYRELAYAGIPHVDVIHGGRTAKQREEAVTGFRSGKVWVLVCTDVMARGLDFKSVQLVINYDFPQTTREYVHRVGRTGRAGKSGRAITLFTERDAPFLRPVANIMRQSGSHVPEWVFAVKPASKSMRKHIETKPLRRASVSKRTITEKPTRQGQQRRVRVPGPGPSHLRGQGGSDSDN